MSLADRRELLALVLDVLVPAGEGFPGGGTAALDHVLGMAAASGDLDRLLSAGLDAAEAEARSGGAPGLMRLTGEGRDAVLQRVERSHPEFLDALTRHAYDGYYSHASVIAQLGLDPRPIHPRGHPVDPAESLDVSRVAARGPVYRSTPLDRS